MTEKKKYDVVVIGAGLGGLCAAALLSHSGYKTLVVEKRDAIGGRWSNYKHEGFWLPAGALAILYHGTQIEEVFNEVGASTEFVRVPQVYYRIGGQDWAMPPKGAIGAMFDIIDRLEDEKIQQGGGLKTFDKDAVSQAFQRGIQERDSLPDISLKDYLLHYTDNEMAHGMFDTIANTIAGAHSWEMKAAAFFTFLVKSKGFRDVSIAPKGNIANVENLARVVRANGDVWTNCPVKKIEVADGRVTGVVVVKDGGEVEIASQVVISNAGPKATIELAGPENFPQDYLGEVRVKVRPHPVTLCFTASDRPIWPEDGSPAYLMLVGARRVTSVVPLSAISPHFAPEGQYLTFFFAGPLTNDVHMDPEVEQQQILLDLKEQFPMFEKHGRVLKFVSKDIDDDLPEMRTRVGEGVPVETTIENLFGVGDGNGPYGLSGSNLAAASGQQAAEIIRSRFKPGI